MGEQNVIDVETDLGDIRLGDHRLNRRCLSIARALQNNPSASFTESLGSDAASEGFYRFMANPRVEWSTLLDEHRDSAYQRALPLGCVLAIHDTSTCQFGGDTVRQTDSGFQRPPGAIVWGGGTALAAVRAPGGCSACL